ncbi:MAG: CheR family methyltransferase, partial [Bacteroidota bacterium]
KIKDNTIYITPPDSEIILNGEYFQLTKPEPSAGPKPSVDTLFASLSKEKKAYSIGIILSGTGSDGAKGIKSIKDAGGITIAQEPQTAKYNGMPLSAIETGQIDLVLSPDKIGEDLKEIVSSSSYQIITEDIIENNSTLDIVLSKLSKRSGTNFANYKPSTIIRRLDKRMNELKINSIERYLKFIEDDPSELDKLFHTILIGVTNFFRDKEAFEELEKHLSKIMASKEKGDQLRIWIAGCATGEEAYSIALLITKLVNGRLQDYNIQIFATDVDENAISIARKGIYSKEAIESVPEDIINNYLLRKGDTFEVIKPIRQLILFSKHDVSSNPPFLKLDLISCRNLLIYFSQNLQKHVIPIFHYSLNPDGYLFLGKSETVGQFTDLFMTIEGKAKIFQRKRGNKANSVRFASFAPKGAALKENNVVNKKSPQKLTVPEMVKETLYNTFDYSYVVIDSNMDVIHISGDVRMFLGINPGTMNTNILKLANKDLQIDLRALITTAVKNNETSKGEIRKLHFFDNEFFVRIVVKPLLYSEPDQSLFVIIFETHQKNSLLFNYTEGEKVDNINEHPRVIELEHELEGVKEHLQTFIEELETANEELQSLNEELQSSNEELQSSNEELETSNEELQSTNEELQIAYAELKAASEEIDNQNRKIKESEANSRALLNNSLQSFILINRDYKIISFNNTAQQRSTMLYGKKLKKGESMIDYKPTGALERFRKDFRKAIGGNFVGGEKVLNTKSGGTRWFRYNFTPVEDEQHQINVVSYSLLDITDMKRLQKELTESENLITSIFNAADIGICVTNEEATFVKVNQSYCNIYGYKMEELIGQKFTIVLPKNQQSYAFDLHQKYLDGHPESAGIWTVKNKDGKEFKVKVSASR